MDVAESRPYRSHRIRACDYCRRRKQRCIVETIGQTCRLCKHQAIECSYTSSNALNFERRKHRRIATPSPRKARNGPLPHQTEHFQSQQSTRPAARIKPSPELNQDIAPTTLENVLKLCHIVGPVVSKDAHTLDQYMAPRSPEDRRTTGNPYNVYSADPHLPVLYTKVDRRRRPGKAISKSPGVKQKNTMDQILAKNANLLIELYV